MEVSLTNAMYKGKGRQMPPFFQTIKFLIIFIPFFFFSELTNIHLNWRRTHARSYLVLSLSLLLYLNVFLSLPHNQSRSCLVCHHCRCRDGCCRSNLLPKFLLVSLSTTTLIFLAEASSSFSFYNHINLFKIKVALLYFVCYATIVLAGAKSLCRSFF